MKSEAINEKIPSVKEIIDVARRVISSKSPGIDGLQPKLWKKVQL
jgi:hypothetical protein